MADKKPNIVFFHVDNLGMGELGCYGGGILRGADTKRADQFRTEGMKLTHYVVEPQCTPTRSALMTGRYPIRSGNHTIALGGNAGGIVDWEITIAEILEKAGYTSSIQGKWHIGAEDGRFPTDHGFDEWYGPLRTYDECMWLDDPQYVAERDGYSYMHEGKKGEGCKPIKSQQLTVETKKTCDLEYLNRSADFMQRAVKADKPFFLYFNHSLMHFPMVTRPEFIGKSKNGEWGDCLLMLDHDFGVLLDKVDELGIRENTIVILLRRQRRRGPSGRPRHRRLLRRLLLQLGGRRHPHAVPDPLARPYPGRRRDQRDGACDRHVHHALEVRRLRAAEGPHHRRQGPDGVLPRQTGRVSTATSAWCG